MSAAPQILLTSSDQPTSSTMSGVTAVVSPDLTAKQDASAPWWVLGIAAVIVICLLYYAYSKFVENSSREGYNENNQQERDDPVADYILADAIEELQNMQRDILKNLSQDTGI